jgi:hypothetical protein
VKAPPSGGAFAVWGWSWSFWIAANGFITMQESIKNSQFRALLASKQAKKGAKSGVCSY